MMKSVNETLNTRKKKVLTFALSGALLLALGSGAAYAANNDLNIISKANNEEGTVIEDYKVHTLSTISDGVQVKADIKVSEDGTTSYSTDGGKTWSKEVPEGLDGFDFSGNTDVNSVTAKAVDEHGAVIEEVEVHDLTYNGGASFDVQVDEDGTMSYSMDGGETWSKEVPEGLDISSSSVKLDGNGVSGKLGN